MTCLQVIRGRTAEENRHLEQCGYVWAERTATWDYLQTFWTKAKLSESECLYQHLVGGYLCPYGLAGEGMLYRDASKKKWATVINATGRQVNTMDLQNYETTGSEISQPRQQ
ncbi:MAG: hypothetical protein ACLUVZ_15965 [Bacteroides stercoris]